MGRIGAVAAMLAAASIALGGCTVAGERIPEPTEAELVVLNERVRDLQWQILQFSPDSPRPAVEFESFTDPDRTAEVYRACMVEAGYADWEPVGIGAGGGPPASERLELYICVSRFPLHPSQYGLYSPAQLDAIYDYYRDSLVPCLEGAGLAVPEPPTREAFVSSEFFAGQWSPYGRDFGLPAGEMAAVYAACDDLTQAIAGSAAQ